jgi:hypothetical protein
MKNYTDHGPETINCRVSTIRRKILNLKRWGLSVSYAQTLDSSSNARTMYRNFQPSPQQKGSKMAKCVKGPECEGCGNFDYCNPTPTTPKVGMTLAEMELVVEDAIKNRTLGIGLEKIGIMQGCKVR